jgi:hypothetical protein
MNGLVLIFSFLFLVLIGFLIISTNNNIGGNPATWSPPHIIGGNPATWSPPHIIGGNPATWSPSHILL